jgi:methylenetetrahydrofolate reductase (NADPH)
MGLRSLFRKPAPLVAEPAIAPLVEGFSIEVMPRTAEKIEDFRSLLPPATRIYIAHIDGTPIAPMVATARRLRDEGFAVMPHFPARSIAGHATLEDWIRRYRDEAGVDEALVLGGGRAIPFGAYDSAMKLLESGLFGKYGFRRLHVAGHPEGNRDIDPDGSSGLADAALAWKQAFADSSDAEMAIVTQFAFDAVPVLEWVKRLRAIGVTLPVHMGVAGPAKLQTLLKYALACGVGPSLKVLQRRAADLTRLMIPFEPDEILRQLAQVAPSGDPPLIEKIHFFPLGGIAACADWARARLETPHSCAP